MKKFGIKWLLILVLVLALSFTLISCNNSSSSQDEPQVIPDEPSDEVVYKEPVLAIVYKDNQDPYESSIINAAKLVCMANDVKISTTVATPDNAIDVITTLKNEESNVIIATSTDFEQYFVDAAKILPNIQFITIGGTKANVLKLANYHNAYASVYEGRYLNGIVAGYKLNQLIADNTITADSARLGFIAEDPMQEQISAYTAFYLGAKSVCPTVKMSVKFAKTDKDIEDATKLLIGIGCKVISQFSYKDEIVTKTCSENDTPIANVTYQTNNSTKYSNSFLTGFSINWNPYFNYLITTLKAKGTVATDWSGNLANDAITLLDVNTSIVPSAVSSAVEEASAKIKNNSLQVFDSSTYTVDKCPVTSYIPAINTTKNAFISSDTKAYIIDGNATLFRSVPYFGLLIDGIYYDSNVTIRSIGQYTIDETQLPDGGDDNLSPAEKFFKALLSASIGIDASDINPETDKVSYTISGYIEYASDIAQSITRAYEINLILDLPAINDENSPSLGDTAIRIRLYNKNTDANYFSIIYFAKDTPDTLYMKYKDQSFKFGLGSSFDINDIIEMISKMGDDAESQAVGDDIASMFADFAQSGDFGEFSLDSITIKSIFDLLGIDYTELILSSGLSTALGAVGINLADIETMSIKELLIKYSNRLIDKDQVVIKENVDGSTTYESKDLSSAIKNIANIVADKILKYISFGLSFTVSEDGYLKDLTFDFYSSYTDYKFFDVKVHVNEITATKITQNATDIFGSTAGYKDYLELTLNASLDLKNQISIYVEDTAVSLGKFDLTAYMALDFINEGDLNKTSIEIKLDSDDEQIFRVVFKDGKVCLDVDMSNPQMQAIANAFLKDFCDVIKDYAVGSKSNVAFKLIGDLADELVTKVFNLDGTINTSFSNITINNLDLFTISRGLLYGLINNILISTSELPIVESTPQTTVSLDVFEVEADATRSYDVKSTFNSLLKLIVGSISYDVDNAVITISFANIKQTIIDYYSSGKNQLKTTSDIMAYFVGTDDAIINDLTIHGLWPLYNGNLNTTKYITADYSIENAIADGYFSMPGSVISKTNAENIWKFISKQETSLHYIYDRSSIINPVHINCTGSYLAVAGDYDTLDDYLDSFTINRYFNLFKASAILGGATNVNTAIDSIFNSTNSLTITYAENDDTINATLIMLGQTFTLGIDFDLLGVDVDDIVVPTFTDTSAVADANKLAVTFDEDFYTLFKAVYGMGYGTSLITDNATNNSLYYIADSATFDTETNKYTAIELSGNVIIIIDDTNYRVITSTATTDGTYSIDVENGTFTSVTLNGADDGTVYNILGSRYKVLVEI